jgi:replicative DNA helicase
MTTEKEYPHSEEAEIALLGAMIIDPDAYWAASDFLKPEHFYKTWHRQVYQGIKALVDTQVAVDPVTLGELLTTKFNSNRPENEVISDLVQLTIAAPLSPSAISYARIVQSTALRRQLNTVAGQIAQLSGDERQPIGEVLEKAERAVFSVTDTYGTKDVTVIKYPLMELYDNTLERRERGGGMVGTSTGYMDLDKMLDGLQRGDLITLAGRPGMGKSALANNIAVNVAKLGKVVGIFNLEMSNEQILQRMVAGETGVSLRNIRRGELSADEWKLFGEATGRLSNMKIFIDDTPGLRPSQLRARCRRIYAEHGLDLIVIDYLGLMEGDGNYQNQTALISYISRQLKLLAKELHTPVLALSQLSRAVEQRADKHPVLSDLRDSGSIEQDSDAVIFIYRDDYYNELSDRPNIVDVDIAKQRNGPTGIVNLYWKQAATLFRNLQRAEINL